MKKADKGLCIVIWGSNNYLLQAEKELHDKKVNEDAIVKTFYQS